VVGPTTLSKAKAQALEQFPGMQAHLGATRILIRDDVGRSVFFHPRTTAHAFGTRQSGPELPVKRLAEQ